MRWGIVVAVGLAAVASAQIDEQKPGLAVFDLKGIDTRPAETQAALNAVVKGLRELDAFDVRSSEDLRELLSLERQRQLLGMEGDNQVSAAVQAVGVKNVVVGSVTRTQGGLSAELRLLDSKDNTVVAQRTVPPQPSLDKLAQALSGIAQELVGPLLSLEQGQLLVRTGEEGAEVVVDDVPRGSTPLPAAIKLPRGRHRLTVKKDGFISRVTVVKVQRDQLTLEEVTLVPSADYVAAYEARNKRLRLGGYLGLGVAAAGFLSALIIDRFVAEPMYQNQFKPRQEALEAVSSGRSGDGSFFVSDEQRDCFGDQDACRTRSRELASSLNTLQAVTWVMVGVGAVGLAAAAYCFVSGEDPNRYAQLVAGITPGGGSIGLVGHW